MQFGHPMHVHLIQFQLIDFATLRLLNDDALCSHYLLDFYKAIADTKGISGYENAESACATYKAIEEFEELEEFFEGFKNENDLDENNVSGTDVRLTCNFTSR